MKIASLPELRKMLSAVSMEIELPRDARAHISQCREGYQFEWVVAHHGEERVYPNGTLPSGEELLLFILSILFSRSIPNSAP